MYKRSWSDCGRVRCVTGKIQFFQNTFGRGLKSVQMNEQGDNCRSTGLFGGPFAGLAVQIGAVLVARTDRVRARSHQQLERGRCVQFLVRLHVDVSTKLKIKLKVTCGKKSVCWERGYSRVLSREFVRRCVLNARRKRHLGILIFALCARC